MLGATFCRRAAVMLVMQALAIGAGYAQRTPPDHPPTDWKLTFDDEFEVFNTSHWNTKFHGGSRVHGSGEEEIYVDPTFAGTGSTPLGLNPFSVRDGVLTIRAERARPTVQPYLGGQLYISGLLTTEHSFSQLYGYFEVRAKLPSGRGLWPAFWLLPTDDTWPPEIDVFEVLGDQPTTIFTSLHMVGTDRPDAQVVIGTHVEDVTADFHTYGVMWTLDFICWFFDGRQVAYTTTPRSVRKPMYLLMNLAVGGHWPGQPDNTTKFPADMQIDYVRAYALPPKNNKASDDEKTD
jgi:beta-glucanase (GH16 family)